MKELISIAEAASYLKMPLQSVYKLTSKRLVPFYKPGKRILLMSLNLMLGYYKVKKLQSLNLTHRLIQNLNLKPCKLATCFFMNALKEKIFNRGYKIVITDNKHDEPGQCYLNEILPNIVIETQYFSAFPLTDSYALDIIKKHSDDQGYLVRTSQSDDLLNSCQAIIDNVHLYKIKRERRFDIYIGEQLVSNIALTKFEIPANPFCELSTPNKIYLSL